MFYPPSVFFFFALSFTVDYFPSCTWANYLTDIINTHLKVLEIQNFRQTLISFDNGGRWERLRFEDGYLNLHLHSTQGQLLSTSSDIGLILATGNEGSYLDTHPSRTKTYISSDGGRKWRKVNWMSYLIKN